MFILFHKSVEILNVSRGFVVVKVKSKKLFDGTHIHVPSKCKTFVCLVLWMAVNGVM